MFLFESLASTIYEEGSTEVMTGLDYIAECDKTASGTFRSDHVGAGEFLSALGNVIEFAERMDQFKKAMFRQKTREEAGFNPGFLGPSVNQWVGGDAAKYDDLIHGIVGLITETGEIAEILRDLLLHGKEPDVTNIREECGDLLWYMSRLMKYSDTTFLTEMRRNITKLRTRHGAGGFNKEADTNRDLQAERQVLEE